MIVAACFGLLSCAAVEAADKVNVAVLNAAGDVGLFIAQERGYFRDEGLEVTLTHIDAAAKMIPLLGTGDLDVGGGATTAGLTMRRTARLMCGS